MEMRKFIVELHTDGSITWAEYSEPLSAHRTYAAICAFLKERYDYHMELYNKTAETRHLNRAGEDVIILRNLDQYKA